jgi:hypothetical protein
LERVRAERVIAMERGDAPRSSHVVGMLGGPPSSVAGRQAWCALAYEIETYRDHHSNAIGHEHEQGARAAIGPSPSSLSDRMSWDHLTRRIADGAGIVAVADALPVEEQPGLGGPGRFRGVWPAVLAATEPACQSLADPSVGEWMTASGFMRQRGTSWELRVYGAATS